MHTKNGKISAFQINIIKNKILVDRSDLNIGRKPNVSRRTVYDIRIGKTWTHI